MHILPQHKEEDLYVEISPDDGGYQIESQVGGNARIVSASPDQLILLMLALYEEDADSIVLDEYLAHEDAVLDNSFNALKELFDRLRSCY